jgi:hypothetical protein
MRSKRWTGMALMVPVLLLAGVVLAWQGFSPPTALAQTDAAITSPTSGSVVTGIVPIEGTATIADFDRYELYFKPDDSDDDAYAYFGGGREGVIDGQLGLWDTADLPPGAYTLRLRVVKADSNYEEFYVSGVVVGEGDTPPATATLTPTVTVTDVVELTVTPTVTPPAEAPIEVPATEETPQVVIQQGVNVREGPGTTYPLLGAAAAGQRYTITGVNQQGDWWQIDYNGQAGWVLARLVNAENIEVVPVVETPVPPALPTAPPIPTPTPTPIVEVEVPAAPVAVEESTVAVAPFPASVPFPAGPITVTILGDDDVDALSAFLRPLLAAYGPGGGAVTATVGALPAPLPVDLELPQTLIVVGSVERSGEYPETQVFLSAPEPGGEQVDVLIGQLQEQGFVVPPAEEFGGPGRVFLSTETFARSLLCSPDNQWMVNLSEVAMVGEPDSVQVRINFVRDLGGPCSQPTSVRPDSQYDILPPLAPAPDTRVQAQGGGSGDNYVEARADLQSVLAAAELADHYETQLADAGWERLDDSRAEAVAWSAWTFADPDGTSWNATFYLVRQGGQQNAYLATLRADRQ